MRVPLVLDGGLGRSSVVSPGVSPGFFAVGADLGWRGAIAIVRDVPDAMRAGRRQVTCATDAVVRATAHRGARLGALRGLGRL
jgi:hypothetical protein